MISNEFPFSEQFRLAAEEWVDKEAAAQLLEDTKSLVLAQKMAKLGDIAVNKAELVIKASPEWHDHVEQIVEARKQANSAKMRLEYEKMRFYENQSREANVRAESRL